ncbi:MAG TPA: hypothetical protein VMK65_07580, partial [Longimicrobiales bacterium]|nr:hypothetical protein [Longimicrobiales bacterium]
MRREPAPAAVRAGSGPPVFRSAVTAILCALPASALLAQDRPAAQVELVLEIGSAFGAEEYTFARVSNVKVGPDGTIYVVDSAEAAVSAYGLRGGFLRRMGREGAGPGDFVRPGWMSVTDTTVLVVD